MKEYLFDLFSKLPSWARLVVFLLILVGVVTYDLLEVFQHVPFWPAVRIVGGLVFVVLLLELAQWGTNLKLMNDLQQVTKDRDDRKAREDALNQVQKSLVWMRIPENVPKFTPTSERQARFIAFCNFKGGVGKTTLSLNVGVALAMKGKRVLLVDLDWQGTLSRLAIPEKEAKQYLNCRMVS